MPPREDEANSTASEGGASLADLADSVSDSESLPVMSTPPTLEDITDAFPPRERSQGSSTEDDTTEDEIPTLREAKSSHSAPFDEATACTHSTPAQSANSIAPPSISVGNAQDERDQSAQEVLQASINFDRSTHHSYVLNGVNNRTSLYPSLDALDTPDYSAEDENGEISDLASTPYAAASIGESTEEATVLGTTPKDKELLATKRAAYAGEVSSGSTSQDPEATVVAISDGDIHPSDISHGAVQAELIGQDYSRPADFHNTFHHGPSDATYSNPNSFTTVEVESEETTTEATVIDSEPIGLQGEVPVWKFTEEARVLTAEDEVAAAAMDRKPAAVESTDQEAAGFAVRDDEEEEGFAIADQEAEILDIEEEMHPSELAGAAEAELVGTDDSYVAVMSNERPAVAEAVVEDDYVAMCREDEITESAELVAESVASSQDSEVREVRATIVEQDYSRTAPASKFPTKPTTSPGLASDTAVDTQETTATPVDDFDDSWMNRPTFVGDGLAPPVAMAPPNTNQSDNSEQETLNWLQDRESPERGSFGSDGNAVSNGNASASSGVSRISGASDNSNPSQRMLSGIARSTGNVMEALFGDSAPPFGRRRNAPDDLTSCILPRVPLPWSVIHSPRTDMWVATLQTNQKALDSNRVEEASKSLRAFSLPSEKQAISLARAWIPPRMHRFSDNPLCHICEAKFAVFRRACHCRNCGVTICKDCVRPWPAKMLPDTYNSKRENSVNVCTSCDWLSTSFRLALLNGDEDRAIALHATGNINLHTPFANVKGELFYPVHCAVEGGKLSLLEWLVDEHCCPIKSVRVSGLGKDSYGKYTAIVTSRGRSLLGIGMENGQIPIVRYLVVEKGIALGGEKDVTTTMLIQNLDTVLRMLPGSCSTQTFEENDNVTVPIADFSGVPPVSPIRFGESPGARSLSEEARDFGAVYHNSRNGESGPVGSPHGDDECIICFDGRIDCVATPCGHQICCLKCSEHIARCPVCAADCSFMKVYKP